MSVLFRIYSAVHNTTANLFFAQTPLPAKIRSRTSSLQPVDSMIKQSSSKQFSSYTKRLNYDPTLHHGELQSSIFASPNRYIQSTNLLSQLHRFLVDLEGTAYIVCSKGGKRRFESILKVNHDMEWIIFNGECSENEILRINEMISKPGFIIALGGGKPIDAGKAVAYMKGLDVVVVPTLASNDAPCSALSVLYKEDGSHDRVVYFPSSPRVVAVDLSVIAAAPKRYFVSGIGDALATFYEADTVQRSGALNRVGGKTTALGVATAQLCRDVLFQAGSQAVNDIKMNRGATEAIATITETLILHSGLGFESGGTAAAHGLHNALVTAVPECHSALHGEKVAFCLIVHLLLEGKVEEAAKIAKFNAEVGLPVTWSELSLHREGVEKAAILACDKGNFCANMDMELNPSLIYEMFVKADKLGKKVLAKK